MSRCTARGWFVLRRGEHFVGLGIAGVEEAITDPRLAEATHPATDASIEVGIDWGAISWTVNLHSE